MSKNLQKSFLGRMLKAATTWLALLPTLMIAQPTVTVPEECIVVVTGTGTGISSGAGGTVGTGGIVIMDYDYHGSFIPNDDGATLITWTLAGDISFTAPGLTGSYSKSVNGAEDIYSFNRRPRSSENLSNNFGARSLGKVSISYQQGACDNILEFFIYKRYDDSSLPPIIGPDCWIPGVKYTYSVDQIASDNLEDAIGIDLYYWTVTNGDSTIVIGTDSTNYYSADKSSITFVAPLVIEGVWEITCCFGRANPWDAVPTSCVTRVIGQAPEMPEIIYPSCVALNATNFMAVVTPYNPEYSYSWGTSVGTWVANANYPRGDTAVITIASSNQDPGNIILTITGCSTVDTTLHIGRLFDSSVGIEISPGTGCYSPEDVITLSTTPPTVANNFTNWVLPDDWVFNSEIPAKSSGWIEIPGNTEGGLYIIKAYSCDDSYMVIDTIYVKPNAPEFITEGGVSPVCLDYDATSPVTYSVTASPGATSYIWSFPEGWTPENDTTLTPTVSVTPAGSTPPAYVSVKASVDESCSSDAVNYPVNYNPVEPDDISADCWNFGVDGNTILTVNNAPSPFFGTYEVSVSPSSLLQCPSCYSVDSSTGEITLQTSASATAGNYNIYVKHKVTGTPSCGTSDSLEYPVAYNIINNASISMLPLGYDLYFVVNPPASPVAYAWFLDCGTTPLSGENNPALILQNGGTPPTSLCVEITKDGCTSRVITTNIGNHSYYRIVAPPSGNSTIATTLVGDKEVIIYPNPNKGSFTADVPAFEIEALLHIYDVSGRLLNTRKLKQGSNSVEERLTSGAYILLFVIDGKTSVQQLQVQE